MAGSVGRAGDSYKRKINVNRLPVQDPAIETLQGGPTCGDRKHPTADELICSFVVKARRRLFPCHHKGGGAVPPGGEVFHPPAIFNYKNSNPPGGGGGESSRKVEDGGDSLHMKEKVRVAPVPTFRELSWGPPPPVKAAGPGGPEEILGGYGHKDGWLDGSLCFLL